MATGSVSDRFPAPKTRPRRGPRKRTPSKRNQWRRRTGGHQKLGKLFVLWPPKRGRDAGPDSGTRVDEAQEMRPAFRPQNWGHKIGKKSSIPLASLKTLLSERRRRAGRGKKSPSQPARGGAPRPPVATRFFTKSGRFPAPEREPAKGAKTRQRRGKRRTRDSNRGQTAGAKREECLEGLQHTRTGLPERRGRRDVF